MKKSGINQFLGAALLSAGFAFSHPASAEVSRVWVEFEPAGAEHAYAALTRAGAVIHYRFDDLNAFAASVPEVALKGLERNPNIVLIEEDVKRFPIAQQVPYGIDKVQARDVWDADRDGVPDAGVPTGEGRKVCLIDSGVDVSHEDFDFSGDNKISGYPSGWNADSCGHGTHVAGTMLAANDAIGVVGVSPGALSLYVVKVFDGPGCGWIYSSDLVDAARRCEAAGANVINMSLGGSLRSRTEDRAFKQLYDNSNILPIAAAGNDGSTRNSYPASYGSVISVGAIDSNEAIASFSQQNSAVELVAPGVGVLSTVPWFSDNSFTANSYTYEAWHMENSGHTVTGSPLVENLVDGGLCDSFDNTWSGKIVICERGNISFYDKGVNVSASGALGAVVYNNAAGGFIGTLGEGNSLSIPMISISQADGQAIVMDLADDPSSQGALVSVFDPNGSGYESWNGTSMATPHVSAVAGLIWSADTTKTNAEIRNALTATAKDLGDSGRDNAFGYGLVQAYDAWQMMGGGSGSDNNQVPTASFTYNCPDMSCSFDASGSSDADGSIVNYAWNFGDNAMDSGVTVNHTYQSAGQYQITLTVTDDKGDKSVNSQTVNIADPTDTIAPVISEVGSAKTKGNWFAITWKTNEPSTSKVVIVGCCEFNSSALVTSHRIELNGSKGAIYEFEVHSSDAVGNSSMSGPHTHHN